MRQKCASLYSLRNALVCPLSAEMQTFAWTPRMWISCYSVSVTYSLADQEVVNGKSYRIACYERKTHFEPENPTAQACLHHTRCKTCIRTSTASMTTILRLSVINAWRTAQEKSKPALSSGREPKTKPNTKPRITASIKVLVFDRASAVPMMNPTILPSPQPYIGEGVHSRDGCKVLALMATH